MTRPLTRRDDVLDFLLNRRSRPAKLLRLPAPEGAELEMLLTAAARTPDHGALVPFRFILLNQAALRRIAGLIPAAGERLGRAPAEIEKQQNVYAKGASAVVVVNAPKPGKIPLVEQQLSAGAVCLSLVNAALAAGWGAAWMSGWASHDPEFRETVFGLSADEMIAGIVHIGTCDTPPPERDRPDLGQIVSRIDA